MHVCDVRLALAVVREQPGRSYHLQIAAPRQVPGAGHIIRSTTWQPPRDGSNISGGIAAIVLPALVLALAAVGDAIAVTVIRHIRIKHARLPQLLG